MLFSTVLHKSIYPWIFKVQVFVKWPSNLLFLFYFHLTQLSPENEHSESIVSIENHVPYVISQFCEMINDEQKKKAKRNEAETWNFFRLTKKKQNHKKMVRNWKILMTSWSINCVLPLFLARASDESFQECVFSNRKRLNMTWKILFDFVTVWPVWSLSSIHK